MMSTLLIKPISNLTKDRDPLSHKLKVDKGELNSTRLRNIFEEKSVDKKLQITKRVDDILNDHTVLLKFRGML
jgi:hypothetical protein